MGEHLTPTEALRPTLVEQIAWLLWCADEGYILAEDRAGMTNWFVDPIEDLHEDDRQERPGWISMAEQVAAALAARDDESGEALRWAQERANEATTISVVAQTKLLRAEAKLARARAILTEYESLGWLQQARLLAGKERPNYFARLVVALADVLSTDEPAPVEKPKPLGRCYDALGGEWSHHNGLHPKLKTCHQWSPYGEGGDA